jgi:hypothetical protein
LFGCKSFSPIIPQDRFARKFPKPLSVMALDVQVLNWAWLQRECVLQPNTQHVWQIRNQRDFSASLAFLHTT